MNIVSHSLRILVVDDSPMLAKTLGWMVESLGHEARIAMDGGSALAIARSFIPDVILLDISLPDINGFDICRQIRSESAIKHAVLIAQSGWSQPEYRERSLAAGFDHYLVKPVSVEMLSELLLTIPKSRNVA